MNSNHNSTAPVAQINNLERAKRLLGASCPVLSGSGRWCLRTPLGAYLFNSRDEAERATLDPSSKYVRIFDIGTDEADNAALERMRDPYDPEERRRERQQRHTR